MGIISSFMRADHERLAEVFRQFSAAREKDMESAKVSFSVLDSEVRRHFDLEEQVLFPLFEEKTGTSSLNSKASVLRIEHKQVLECMCRIKSMLDDGNLETAYVENRILEIMKSHRDNENNIVYPWLDEALTSEEIKETDSRMRKC